MSNIIESRGSEDIVSDDKVYESSIGNVHLIQSSKNTIANRLVYNGPVTIYQQV